MTPGRMTPTQSLKLAQQCNELSNALGDYLMGHLKELDAEERRRIQEAREELIGWSGKLIQSAIRLQLADLQGTLARIESVTGEVRDTIGRIQRVRDAVEVATAVLKLGRAIATGDAGAIVNALDRTADVVGRARAAAPAGSSADGAKRVLKKPRRRP